MSDQLFPEASLVTERGRIRQMHQTEEMTAEAATVKLRRLDIDAITRARELDMGADLPPAA
jgi:hypothetical protein